MATTTSLRPARHGQRSGGHGGLAHRRRHIDQELARRYHRNGDVRAREELIRRLMPLAREQARRYAYTNEPLEDLIQVAYVGLVKAVERFDPAHGSRLASYAVPTIRGELRRYFRDMAWALHVPRELKERALAVSRATERLSARLGRSPSMREIAAELDISVEQTIEAAQAAWSYETLSLDAQVAHGDAPDDAGALGDMLGDDDTAFALVATRELVANAWSALSDTERNVLQMRVAEGLTQREIGERIGYSQMHVSRVLRRALERLTESTSLKACA